MCRLATQHTACVILQPNVNDGRPVCLLSFAHSCSHDVKALQSEMRSKTRLRMRTAFLEYPLLGFPTFSLRLYSAGRPCDAGVLSPTGRCGN